MDKSGCNSFNAPGLKWTNYSRFRFLKQRSKAFICRKSSTLEFLVWLYERWRKISPLKLSEILSCTAVKGLPLHLGQPEGGRLWLGRCETLILFCIWFHRDARIFFFFFLDDADFCFCWRSYHPILIFTIMKRLYLSIIVIIVLEGLVLESI